MDINTLTALAAWAAVACALIVVWLQNRATKRLTSLQLFMQLAAQYDSLDMQRARASLAQRLLANPTSLDIDDTLLVFYENIAILHRRKLLDSELMYNTFSYDVRSYWLVLKPYILKVRKAMEDDDFFREFEDLNDHFIQDGRTRNAKSKDVTLERANEILSWEVRRAKGSAA